MKSYYLANKIVDHENGKTAYTMPQVFVGLLANAPTQGLPPTNVNEFSGNGYGRVATTGATWNPAVAGSATNAQAITFPTATADQNGGANATHFGFFDALTGGNLLDWSPLTTPKNALKDDTLSFAAGSITRTLSGS